MTGITIVVLIFVIFLAFCMTTVPIGIALGLAVVVYVFTIGKVDMSYITTNMFASCDSFPLMAIPFFVLAGALMEGGGLSKRLVDFCDTLVGNKTGGLAIVTVLTSMLFGAISGSAPATVAAIGTIMVPTMIQKGYDKKFTLALVAAAGCLGTIIPPSIPMVMFGVATGASISTLFMAGFLPGIVCGIALIIVAVYISKKQGYVGNGIPFSIKRVWIGFRNAIGALLVPVIILGGIYGGIFTPTEAAVVAVVYGLFAGKFIYKELTFKRIITKISESAQTTGTIMIIVGTGTILGRVMALEQAPQAIANGLSSVTDNPIVILILLNIILLIAGCLMDTTCAILILAPILYPVAALYGVDIIHFGIMMVVNLSIGFITPPVGVNLFVACSIGQVPFTSIVKKILPFLAVLIVALMFLTYIPEISLFVPHLLGK
jgi:C4-dicarboxylate transporter DctM subunit